MVVMTIAGVDPSAGAGVYADIKTFQAHGVYGTGVITAITAQNPNKVYSIKPIDAKFIEEQIDAIMDSYNVRYVKTGMLYSSEIADVVYDKTKEYSLKTVVDPVMVATSGSSLYKDELIESIKKLIKISIFTTPNVDEASKLTGIKITDKYSAIDASLKIGKYCNNIITGGHLHGINIVNINKDTYEIKQELIESSNTHGSGCNFSSAIVANLEKGDEIQIAIEKAIEYTSQSIENGAYGTLIQKISGDQI